MSNSFDELTKGMAHSITRRGALKHFGLGLVGMVLGSFGLANKSEAGDSACNICKQSCKANGGTPATCNQECYLFCHKIKWV